MTMKNLSIVAAAVLVLSAGSHAFASTDSPKTRAQVKAELAEAIRTGDILADAERGLKLNELRPDLYPLVPHGAGKTRQQVREELAEAIRKGDILEVGDQGLKLNEVRPDLYPSVTSGVGKTREQVRAELAEAVRTGEILVDSDRWLKQNELRPDLYPKAHVSNKTSGDTLVPSGAAASSTPRTRAL